MPLITVYPDVIRAYNRVEVDWADTPSVGFARVLRVDAVTGECTPLRPYICFDGDYLALSCGHGIFWDTEVPLDRSVYYITEGLGAPCIPADSLAFDDFTRVSASTWTTATSGQAYSIIGGVAANYTVNGLQGVIAVTATSSDRISYIDVGESDQDVTLTLVNPVLPTGSNTEQGIAFRVVDATNYYLAMLTISVGGTVTLRISKFVAGVLTIVGSFVTALMASAGDLTIRVRAVADSLRARAWFTVGTEPTTWDLDLTDSDLAGTGVGGYARRTGGNLTPTSFTFDNLIVTAPCVPCDPVDASTVDTPTTMPSNGAFRLRDPVRPCNDQYVPLCFTPTSPLCLPTSGIFFASMDDEVYAPNSLILNPTNAALPLSVNRQRRGVASVLTVVTRTFADRDALIALNAPGEPLLLSGPPQYGIGDIYMAVGDLNIIRELSDHKYPTRVINLPFLRVARPVGPSLGVCGSRMTDLCDVYSTFDEMAAAGLTWDDLVRGRAGSDDPTAGYRTWDSAQAEFADWNDANDGVRTWFDMQVGN